MPINMPDKHPEAKIRKLMCGGCQWFSAGYEGQTCRKTRDVEVLTTACVEYRPIFEDPYHNASQDKFLVGVNESLLSDYFTVDPKLTSELKDYIIRLDEITENMGRNAEYNVLNTKLKQVVAYRARITEVYADCIEVKHDLLKVADQASMWLYSKYPFMMELRNEEQRKAAFDRILPYYRPTKSSVDRLSAMLELVDSKLTQNERTLRTILEASIKMVYSTDRIKT